jgi:hypothetical protein
VRLAFGDFMRDTDTRQLLRVRADAHLSPSAVDPLSTLIESRP